ncbi:MAG: periplasmic heavy metal sensor [Alphaproteobacteria bacterium]
MNRKLKIVFIASLTLNVLLIGVLLGQSPRRFDRGALRQQRMDQALKGLPASAQTRLREKFQQLRAAAGPLFEQVRKNEEAAAQLLGKEPFDEPAYDHQVSKIIEMRAEMTKRLSQVVKDASKDLSAEERKRFAQLLRPSPPANP